MSSIKGIIIGAFIIGSILAVPSLSATPEIAQPKDDVALSVRFGGGGYHGPYYRGRRYYRPYGKYYGPYRYRYYRNYPYGGYYYRGYNPYWYGPGGRVYFRFGI